MATQKAREELARQSGFEDLSFATRSYRPEYASTPDIRGSNRPERVIRTSEIEPTLRAKLAFTSGGRDRQSRSILTIPAGKSEDLSVDRLGDTLSYLIQAPRDHGQSQMYTVIIDLRGSSWKSAKPLLRTLQETIPDKVHEVCIIKPDAFWEKRRSGTGLKKEQSSVVFETTLLSSSSKLHQFAEDSQLTHELGGTLPYNHNRWIDTRLEIERLSDEAISLNENFDELEQDLDTHLLGSNITDTEDLLQQHEAKRAMLDNVGHPLIQRGEHLISSIKANESPVPPSQNFRGVLLPCQAKSDSRLKTSLRT
ncbi:S14 domain and spectrin repeat-containing protein 1 [Desmophyllum pertusum]|uniref:S14 domain and spectrin repeat-containing protein 1 n=1 Tax=Desmophyllum pertusum TaxID=174260 RepID=A0A9X0CIL1_9CNID|nr:S14 domain and spectrin repeat-containing protein 1 [Desmophyllum pertusum]